MESIGTGPSLLLAPAAFSPERVHPQQQQSSTDSMALDALSMTTPIKAPHSTIEPQSSSWLDTPANISITNHFEASNVRGSTDQDAETSRLLAPLADTYSSLTPYDGSWTRDDDQLAFGHAPYGGANGVLASEPKTPSNPASFDTGKQSAAEATEAEQLTRAYAMVKFRDSHCYVTTPNLVIVRDVNFLQDWQAQEKERKRRARAHEALQQYALEPSQPSQPGDDDRNEPSSRSGESLVGRPERGLLSHYSEQGGPVAYALSDEEEEMRSTQRKRRLLRTLQNSSSANSIAPQNLHPNEGSEFLRTGLHFDSEGHPSDPLEWAQLPVHPPRPEDIKKISREHLIFTYNSDLERWELKVIGNRAFVNGALHDKHDVVPLAHNDEIIIASLTMNFMLPDDLVKEAESEVAGDDIVESVEAGSLESPISSRRLSNLVDDSDEEDDDDAEDELDEPVGKKAARIRPKIKLSLKSSSAKDGTKTSGGKGKDAAKAEKKLPSTSESPESTKKANRARKSSDAVEIPKKESSAASPPALPLNLDPNSTLAGLAPEELPEKRKGPGRPPKNGLVSKRDEAIIRKKIKEREKKGLPIPEYKALLEETRNENRQRDLANKAQARGEPLPDIPVPSIEHPRLSESGQASAEPLVEGKALESGSPHVPERKPSPKPRRVVRSPSPMKPMSAFNEEELKKPNMTYIYIIDEILQNVEGGQADLQTIYDKIQKRWPYYRYKVTSSGWQSSVRHNLLSCPRFVDAGKSGKGKFWTINQEHQLDKQKRKPSPPPSRPQPVHSLQNGPFAANPAGIPTQWHGQAPYNGLYGPANLNGHAQPNALSQPGNGTYYSPYAPSQPPPPGGHLANQGPHSQQMHVRQAPNDQHMRQAAHMPPPPHANGAVHRVHGHHSQSHAHSQATPFQPVVDAIMNYRNKYIGRCVPDSDEFRQFEDRFKKGTQYFSNLFHNQANEDMTGEDLSAEPFNQIEKIFESFKYLFTSSQQSSTSAAVQSNTLTNGLTQSATSSQGVNGHEHAGDRNSNVAPAVLSATDSPLVGSVQQVSTAAGLQTNHSSIASIPHLQNSSFAPSGLLPTDSPLQTPTPATSLHPVPVADMGPEVHNNPSVGAPSSVASASTLPPSSTPNSTIGLGAAATSSPAPPAHLLHQQYTTPPTPAQAEVTGNVATSSSQPVVAGIKREADSAAGESDAKRTKTE